MINTTQIRCKECGMLNRVKINKLADNPICGACQTILDIQRQPVHVSDEIFDEEVLRSSMPVVVDFWAPWCGPCRTIAPVLEVLAKEFAGRVTIAKINTDENKQNAAQLGIRGIPTLILFRDGKEFDRIVGAADKSRLVQFIEKALTETV